MIKDVSISVIRLISLIMIISCHILQGIGNEFAYWVNLGVQIFFFMSGYLYGKKNIIDYKKFYKERILKILLPTTILVMTIVIANYFIFDVLNSKNLIMANLLGFGGFYGTLTIISHTWFIGYILFCYFITPILQFLFDDSNNKLKTLLIITSFLVLIEYYGVTRVNPIWVSNFILGYYYTRCCNTEKSRKRFFISILILSFLLLPINLIIRYDLITSIPSKILAFENYIWDWGHVFLGILLFLLFYKILSKFNVHYNKILKFSDKYSFFIYLTHQIFILYEYSILYFTDFLAFNIILIYLLSIVSALMLYYTNKIVLNIIIKLCTSKNCGLKELI